MLKHWTLPIALCRRRRCCPSLDYDQVRGEYVLKDDHGGVVRLEPEHLDTLAAVWVAYKKEDKTGNELD